MASAGLSYEELQVRKKLLLDQLQETQNAVNKTTAIEGAIDIHHPERSAGWPRYKHQSYPKMMYHPVKLDAAIEAVRLGTRRRNDANPSLAPLDIPAPKPLRKIVHSEAEEKRAEQEGFVRTPPELKMEEESAPNRATRSRIQNSGQGLCSRGCGKRTHRGSCSHRSPSRSQCPSPHR